MNYLHALRIERGLTQQQLAQWLGVDPSLISRCERGWFTRPPSGLEGKLTQFFGPEWTWKKLMQPVPSIATMSGGRHENIRT